MQFSLSRSRESLADASSVELTRNPAGLLHALQKLQQNDKPFAKMTHATAAMCIDDPLQHHGGFTHHLFDTHPPDRGADRDPAGDAPGQGDLELFERRSSVLLASSSWVPSPGRPRIPRSPKSGSSGSSPRMPLPWGCSAHSPDWFRWGSSSSGHDGAPISPPAGLAGTGGGSRSPPRPASWSACSGG